MLEQERAEILERLEAEQDSKISDTEKDSSRETVRQEIEASFSQRFYQLPLLDSAQIYQVVEMIPGSTTDGVTISLSSDRFYDIQAAAFLLTGQHDTYVLEWDNPNYVGDWDSCSSRTF